MAKATNWIKINLFLSSCFPIFALIVTMYIINQQAAFFATQWLIDPIGYYKIISVDILIAIVFLWFTFFPIRRIKLYIDEILAKNYTEKITIQSHKVLTNEYLIYLLIYFMIFVIIALANWIILIGALLTIAVLYIRANLFHINPTLLMFYNYRLYLVTDEKNNTFYLLSKNVLLNNHKIEVRSLNDNLYIEKNTDEKYG